MSATRLAPWTFALMISLLPVWAGQASVPATDPQTVDHIEDTTIFFKKPDGTVAPIKTSLHDLIQVGKLGASTQNPLFLFLGKPCATCQDDNALHAISPTQGKKSTFVQPGKILDPKSRALLYEARGFFGKCIPGHGDLYVSFQKERVDRRSRLQESVFIAELSDSGDGNLHETLLERRFPKLKTTLGMVKRKSCQEVAGRNRLMASKPLDLNPRANTDEEEDDSDENEDSSPK